MTTRLFFVEYGEPEHGEDLSQYIEAHDAEEARWIWKREGDGRRAPDPDNVTPDRIVLLAALTGTPRAIDEDDEEV